MHQRLFKLSCGHCRCNTQVGKKHLKSILILLDHKRARVRLLALTLLRIFSSQSGQSETFWLLAARVNDV